MNAKEKAQDLYLKFYAVSPVRPSGLSFVKLHDEDKHTALRSATAHVDLLLKTLGGIDEDYSIDISDHILFYNEVRAELIEIQRKPTLTA